MATTYEAIATTTIATATPTVDFTSISSAYTDIICVSNATASASAYTNITFNNDSGSNYSNTYISGNGTTAVSGRGSNQTIMIGFYMYSGASPATNIFHLMNYSNTTTYKTCLTRFVDAAYEVNARVTLWRSASAINRITLTRASGNFSVGSTFTLYGIKAA
jgi:hypothetical protein